MFPDPDHIRLTETPRALAELTGRPPPPCHLIRKLARDCRIPADVIDGFWYVRKSNLEAIAVLVQIYRVPRRTARLGVSRAA